MSEESTSKRKLSLHLRKLPEYINHIRIYFHSSVTIGAMAKKKKKKSSKRREMQQEAKEELEVLAAIFGDHFTLDEDAHGFSLQVVPHPGRTEPNYVSVQLSARYVG